MQRADTEVLFATDEWFAVAGNLNQEDPPKFDPNAFDNEGKLMDGWETRRKRTLSIRLVALVLLAMVLDAPGRRRERGGGRDYDSS